MIEEQNYKYIYIYHTWKKFKNDGTKNYNCCLGEFFLWFWVGFGQLASVFLRLTWFLAILQLLQVTPFQIERLTMIPNSGRRKGSTPVDLNRRNGSADPVDLRRRNGSADPLYLNRRNGSADPVDLSRRNGSADPVDRINISEEPYLR